MNQESNSLWPRNLLKDPHRLPDKTRRVRAMFSGIAGSYDLLNHLLSLNLDRSWRRRAVELAQVGAGQSVLDLCCGTGDLALAFARAHPDLGEIIGVDFARSMLDLAAKKTRQFIRREQNEHPGRVIPKWLYQNVEQLDPIEKQFDCVSCGFGIRNLQDIPSALEKMYGLLKPSGRVVILEFALPRYPILAWGFACYFRLVLPVIGGIISNDRNGAYQYLPASVCTFDSTDRMERLLRETGFSDIRVKRLSGGVAVVFIGLKK